MSVCRAEHRIVRARSDSTGPMIDRVRVRVRSPGRRRPQRSRRGSPTPLGAPYRDIATKRARSVIVSPRAACSSEQTESGRAIGINESKRRKWIKFRTDETNQLSTARPPRSYSAGPGRAGPIATAILSPRSLRSVSPPWTHLSDRRASYCVQVNGIMRIR